MEWLVTLLAALAALFALAAAAAAWRLWRAESMRLHAEQQGEKERTQQRKEWEAWLARQQREEDAFWKMMQYDGSVKRHDE